MRILLAGDTSANLLHLQYLVQVAKKKKCDRIFVLGDFGYWEHQRWCVQFLDRLDRYCNIDNIVVYFLDGNHDKTSLLLEKYDKPESLDAEGFLKVRPYVRYARRGHRWTWDHLKFIALGGAYSVDKEDRLAEEFVTEKPQSLWFPEEEMTDEDMAMILLADNSSVDVMLAHDKPRGSNPGWDRPDLPECWPNQDRLQLAVQALTPQQFYHGHLHWPYRDEFRHSTVDGRVSEVAVIGLACDPGGARYSGYRQEQSWQVLDTIDMIPRSFLVGSTDSQP